MKHEQRFLILLSLIILVLALLVSCTDGTGERGSIPVTLDMSSDTVKTEVTVKSFVDGDTTHFNVPSEIVESGVLKARYLAINTPESTGKIEEYGKAASAFTRAKLSGAESIIIESDNGEWNLDSTGGRYLVWVWYKPAGNTEYRNLNIEILENGLAIASSSANNRYGEACVAAINLAKEQKLSIYSGEPDPDYYYGGAVELTLKELRCNAAEYNGVKVAFEGVVTVNYNNSVYVEEYDADSDMYYGITVYYGYGLAGEGLNVLAVGNRSRIVGTVQYYEAGGTYQVSGLTYRVMKPDDPNNIKKISEGNAPAYRKIMPDCLGDKVVRIESGDGENEFSYAYLSLGTTVAMDNLYVRDAYTTLNEDSSSYGAITLTCEADGNTVYVRTAILTDEHGKRVTEDAFLNKSINVRGIVDYYNGTYQVKVFSYDNIEIN